MDVSALSAIAPVSRETVEKLKIFVDLFTKWSARINLTARGSNDIWGRHIADSLQLIALAPGPRHWVDLGSGGGFPGVITAIALSAGNDGWVDLIESNGKKAAFLRTVLHQTGARGTVHAIRAEAAPRMIPHCDAISARALAGLDDLLTLIRPWAQTNPALTSWLHKGRDYHRELSDARGRWRFDLVEHQSKIDSESVVLEISALQPL